MQMGCTVYQDSIISFIMAALSLSAKLITGLMICHLWEPWTWVDHFVPVSSPAEIHESVCITWRSLKQTVAVSDIEWGGGVDLHNATLQTHIHTAARVQCSGWDTYQTERQNQMFCETHVDNGRTLGMSGFADLFSKNVLFLQQTLSPAAERLLMSGSHSNQGPFGHIP